MAAVVERRVPAYLFPSKIAKATGFSRKTVLTLLRGANILERRGRWALVARGQLRERFPDLYEDVYEFYVMGTPEPE